MNAVFEQIALALLGKLLPWAIERAWQKYKGSGFFCTICHDTVPPNQPTPGVCAPLCIDCRTGLADLVK